MVSLIINRGFLHPFRRLFVPLARVLHLLQQIGQGLIVHRFETGEGQGRLVADGEEDDGVAGRGGPKFKIKEAFIEDADVLAGEVREIDWRGNPDAGPSLPELHARAGEALQHVVDVAVREHFPVRFKAGILEDSEGAQEAVRRGGVARGEELAAVGGDGQFFVVGPGMDEAEEGQRPRPGAPGAGEAIAAASGDLLHLFDKTRQAVGAMVEGVIAGQEIPGFGEEDDDHPHDHPYGGSVDLGRIDACALFFQDVAMALDEDLDSLADPFAQDGREFRLPLAAVEDRLQERGRRILRRRCPKGRGEEGPQGGDLGGEGASFEPELRIPFAPGVEIETGKDQTPLAAVGQDGEAFASPAEPLNDMAHGAAAASDAEAGLVVDKDGEGRAGCSAPEVAGLHRFAHDGVASPFRTDLGSPLPGTVCGGKTADLFQDKAHEVHGVRAAVEKRPCKPAQFTLLV